MIDLVIHSPLICDALWSICHIGGLWTPPLKLFCGSAPMCLATYLNLSGGSTPTTYTHVMYGDIPDDPLHPVVCLAAGVHQAHAPATLHQAVSLRGPVNQ